MCRAHFMMDYFKYGVLRTTSSNDKALMVYTIIPQLVVHTKISFSPLETLLQLPLPTSTPPLSPMPSTLHHFSLAHPTLAATHSESPPPPLPHSYK